MLSVGNVQKDVTWSAKDSSFVCCGPHHRDCLGKECYTSIFDHVDEESITGHFKRFVLCTFSGDKYGSSLSRGDRSSCGVLLEEKLTPVEVILGLVSFSFSWNRQSKSMDSLLRAYLLLCAGFSHILHGTLQVLQLRCGPRIFLNQRVRPLSFLLKDYMEGLCQYLLSFNGSMCQQFALFHANYTVNIFNLLKKCCILQ